MKYLFAILLISHLNTNSYSQAQTDLYLILDVKKDTIDLRMDYVLNGAYIEYSIDDQDNRFLKIVKSEDGFITHGPLEFVKQGKVFNTKVYDWKWSFSELNSHSKGYTDLRFYVNGNDITFVLNYKESKPYVFNTVYIDPRI